MYFRNYGLRNKWLDKCLKTLDSEDPSTANMLNVPKSCFNLNSSTFTIFVDQRECNRGGKSLSLRHLKSQDYLLID